MRALSRWLLPGLSGVVLILACSGVQLQPGERLVRAKCTACHILPERDQFDRSGWIQVLQEHGERFPLSDQEREEVLDWLSPLGKSNSGR